MSKSIETDPARTVRGAVIRRGDTGYEEARLAAVWNERKPDRFPAVIVIAEDEQDVVRAVRLARSEGLRVSIRSGGHSWVGNGVRDGGMLIDLSRLQEITVDPGAGPRPSSPPPRAPRSRGPSRRTGCSSPPAMRPPWASEGSSSAVVTVGTPGTSVRPA
ncbi:FAD-dependent oxidoreductase [Actinomadura madurae]|nr:FAD-binding protein [Actinomadura madurae]URN03182.1 FAD-dependent oxidoreductase [Actinomadura madurae]